MMTRRRVHVERERANYQTGPVPEPPSVTSALSGLPNESRSLFGSWNLPVRNQQVPVSVAGESGGTSPDLLVEAPRLITTDHYFGY